MKRLAALPALVMAGLILSPVAHGDGDSSFLPPLIEQT